MGHECAENTKSYSQTHRHSAVRHKLMHTTVSHPYDDAYGCCARCGHHFGTVRDKIEEHWNNGFCSMIKLIP